jgi:hypothetical protein
MAIYFIKTVEKAGDRAGLTGTVIKGVLKDSLKLNIEGKTGTIERMERRNPKSMRVEWMKGANEKEIAQVLVKEVDLETLKTCTEARTLNLHNL